MRVIGLDPGYIESAFCVYDGSYPRDYRKIRNEDLLQMLSEMANGVLVIEQIKNYGMPTGDELFDTVLWSGRFIQEWHSLGRQWARLTRKQVVGHICNSGRATDANIRQAIIDRYGGKEKAIGRKKTPGPLYGLSKDCWSALAIAITWHEMEMP